MSWAPFLSLLCPSFLISEIEMIIPANAPMSLALSFLLQTFWGYHLPRKPCPWLYRQPLHPVNRSWVLFHGKTRLMSTNSLFISEFSAKWNFYLEFPLILSIFEPNFYLSSSLKKNAFTWLPISTNKILSHSARLDILFLWLFSILYPERLIILHVLSRVPEEIPLYASSLFSYLLALHRQ